MIKKIWNNVRTSYYEYKLKKDDNVLDINVSISELIVGILVCRSEGINFQVNLDNIVSFIKIEDADTKTNELINNKLKDRIKSRYKYLNEKYPDILKTISYIDLDDGVDYEKWEHSLIYDCKFAGLNHLREKYQTWIFDVLYGFDYEVAVHVDNIIVEPHVIEMSGMSFPVSGPEFSIKIHTDFYDIKKVTFETIDNFSHVLCTNEHNYCEDKLMELLEDKEEFPVGEYFLIVNSSWPRDEVDKRLSELVNLITNIHE